MNRYFQNASLLLDQIDASITVPSLMNCKNLESLQNLHREWRGKEQCAPHQYMLLTALICPYRYQRGLCPDIEYENQSGLCLDTRIWKSKEALPGYRIQKSNGALPGSFTKIKGSFTRTSYTVTKEGLPEVGCIYKGVLPQVSSMNN